MFERFTDRARKVLVLANQEAQRFRHESVGCEHILLGLVKEGGGVGANVLTGLGLDLRNVRLEVEKSVQGGTELSTESRLPLQPSAKRIIEFAAEEARNMNHNYVGTEHLLLGLMRERGGVAALVLMNLGVKLDQVREEVLTRLGGGVDPLNDCSGPSAHSLESLHNNFPRLLHLAAEEARRVGAVVPTPDHLLIAMARDGSTKAGEILRRFGLTPEHLEQLLRE